MSVSEAVERRFLAIEAAVGAAEVERILADRLYRRAQQKREDMERRIFDGDLMRRETWHLSRREDVLAHACTRARRRLREADDRLFAARRAYAYWTAGLLKTAAELPPLRVPERVPIGTELL